MSHKKPDKDKGFFAKVSSKTHKDFKLKCIEKGLNLNDQIELLMSTWIKKQK